MRVKFSFAAFNRFSPVRALPMLAFLGMLSPLEARADFTTTLTNFNDSGYQITRYSTTGDAVDAHDGEIALFNGTYYLYGTSYDCGYQWGTKNSAFCGFKAYSSPDLVHWTDRGFLFDARSATWQNRCNGNTYGCYRPHVIRNPLTRAYVLWINVYDNSVGFRVFTSLDPAGPFVETAVPTLAVNNGAPSAGLNNGDHDTFLDEDGKAYLAYTDWKSGGAIAIEQLDSTYQSGSGKVVKGVTPGSTEAPAMFRRGNLYYLTYSDPNCGYCAATGTSYRTAASPLGAWSAGKKISGNSCGGQPSFVAPINLTTGMAYLYGSDLWNKAAKNEALANYFWGPLSFADDGSINPLDCRNNVVLPLVTGSAGNQIKPVDLDNTAGVAGFRTFCDIGSAIQRSQSFVATRTGTLTGLSFTTFRDGGPTAPIELEIHRAGNDFRPAGPALYAASFSPDSIGWSPRNLNVNPGLAVAAGIRYAVVIKSMTTQGCYGFAYNDSAPYPAGGAAYSDNAGVTFTAESNRTLKFQTTISSSTSMRGNPHRKHPTRTSRQPFAYPAPVLSADREFDLKGARLAP